MNHTEEDQTMILSGIKELTLADLDPDKDMDSLDDGEVTEDKVVRDKRNSMCLRGSAIKMKNIYNVSKTQ